MHQLQSVNFFDPTIKNKPMQRIIGGYVEFSILEETHVHYFTQADDLRQLEQYISVDKPLLGLRQFIKELYAPANCNKQAILDNDITIWNHDFVLM